MTRDELLNLYAYDAWATRRILDTARRITASQLHEPMPFGFGSIRDLLAHVANAHVTWLSRWSGEPRAPIPEAAALQSVEDVKTHWEHSTASSRAYVARQSDPDLRRVLRTTSMQGQEYELHLWQAMVHVVNHGTHHRAECAAALTSLGHSPGDLDFALFIRQ